MNYIDLEKHSIEMSMKFHKKVINIYLIMFICYISFSLYFGYIVYTNKASTSSGILLGSLIACTIWAYTYMRFEMKDYDMTKNHKNAIKDIERNDIDRLLNATLNFNANNNAGFIK